jgi:hypothetical protein
MNKIKWREDYRKNEEPTFQVGVNVAHDEIDKTVHHTLQIQHMKFYSSNGFMSILLGADASPCTGGHHLGEDEETYKKAVSEGRDLLERKEQELKDEFEKGEERRKKAKKAER